MNTRSKKALDRFQISGFGLSALASFLLILGGYNSLASVTFGLVLAALTQLFDLQIRQEAIERRLLRAGKLSQLLWRDDQLHDRMERLVRDYFTIMEDRPNAFRGRAKEVVAEAWEEIRSLAEGTMEFGEKNLHSFGRKVLTTASKEVNAVCSPAEFRMNGRGYIERHRDLVQSGVKITRIFIIDGDNALKTYRDLLLEHQAMGVDVYVARAASLDAEYRNKLFVIVDERIFSLLVDRRAGLKRWKMSVKPVAVKEMVASFAFIMNRARPLGEVL